MHHIISNVKEGLSKASKALKNVLSKAKNSISNISIITRKNKKRGYGRAHVQPMRVSRTRTSVGAVQAQRSSHRYAARRVNRKRFTVVVAVAAVAVMVPVMVLAGTGDNTVQPQANEIIEPEAVPVSEEITPSETPEESSVPEFTETTQAAVEESTEVEAEATPVPTETPEPEPQYVMLTAGAEDASVPALQERLMELHYMSEDQPTEYFGPATLRAVQAFQRKHELAVDGAAGPETQAAIFADTAKEYSAAIGADGDDVSLIQERLDKLGYDVAVTGHFGEATEKAVKYFQRMNGLTDDGSVGSMTKDILFSDNAEPSEEKVAAEKKKAAEEEEAKKKKNNESSGSSKSSGKSSGSSSKGKGSSGGGSKGGGSAPAANPGSVEAFIDAAMAQVGKPYSLGAKGPDAFDCSGFVYYALQQSGNGIGYMTSGGWAGSGYTSVGWDDLQRGDIVCVSGHVGIYLGGGQIVDASSGSGQIVVRGMGSWFQSRFICGKRVL